MSKLPMVLKKAFSIAAASGLLISIAGAGGGSCGGVAATPQGGTVSTTASPATSSTTQSNSTAKANLVTSIWISPSAHIKGGISPPTHLDEYTQTLVAQVSDAGNRGSSEYGIDDNFFGEQSIYLYRHSASASCSLDDKGLVGIVDIKVSHPDPTAHGNVYKLDDPAPGYETTYPWAACQPSQVTSAYHPTPANYCHGNQLFQFKVAPVRPGDTYVADLVVTPAGAHVSDPVCPSTGGIYTKIGAMADCGTEKDYTVPVSPPLETGERYIGHCRGQRTICVLTATMAP